MASEAVMTKLRPLLKPECAYVPYLTAQEGLWLELLAGSAVLASFALAAYEDIREREVHDLIWAPGIVGLALLLLLNPLPYRLPLALFLGAAGYLAARLGYVGQADAIALLLWSSLGGALEFILASLGALAGLLGHLALLKLRGRRRAAIMPLARALSERHWLPRRVFVEGRWRELPRDVNRLWGELERYDPSSAVEVEFGVPMVAYLALGYLLAYVGAALGLTR